MLVAPGETTTTEASAEGIIAHEYGHHVAASRNNAPWDAVDYGTKRWASYMNVCARTESGEFYPGDESESNYRLNPGEGFAEAYRVLNERRLGLPESLWGIVSTSLPAGPDRALAARAGRRPAVDGDGNEDGARQKSATYNFRNAARRATRRPGCAALGKKTRYRVDVTSAGGSTTRRTTAAGGSIATRETVCGQRSVRVRLGRRAGTGELTLTLSTP